MAKTYRPYELDQALLLPPNMLDWLPENHLVRFIIDTVGTFDLLDFYRAYEQGSGRGQPPYHPAMMVSLLLYAYCIGKPSSRKIEKATYEEIPFRVLTGDQHPDHSVIADFRKRHLKALATLFVQVLRLCEKAGMVKVGHVALDGTRVKANASKHKAMSYQRMTEAEQRLEAEVAALLANADAVDAAEDAQYGTSCRGDELPQELARGESRLKKIREAKAQLEAEAKEKAAHEAAQAEEQRQIRARKEKEMGHKMGGHPAAIRNPDQATPDPKAQKNFTDPESRIMKDGASNSFEQAYNAQAAVDSEHQIIVAAAVTQEVNDKQQLIPMMEKVAENTGHLPGQVSADAGYFSEHNVTHALLGEVDLFIPPDCQHHGTTKKPKGDPPDIPPDNAKAIEKMRHKLKTPEGYEVYRKRKQIVEPVFGQIKEVRGFRRFSFRGLGKVSDEWTLICLTHNLLKLFRAGRRVHPA